MSQLIICCPVCKKQYKLIPKDENTIGEKTFTCPNCNYSTQFKNLIKDQWNGEHVTRQHIPGSPPTEQKNHKATKINAGPGSQSRAFLTVANTNSKFILNPGIYVLGRMSSDSTATLQIAPDISISRQHARMAVQVVGGKLMAQIMGLKEYNPVLINSKILPHGKHYTLKPGDVIQLGQTRCIFSI